MSKIAALVDEIRALGAVPTEDEDDGLTICPAASDERIAEFRSACGGILPGDVEEFLRETSGFEHTFLEWKPEPVSVGDGVGFEHLLRASHYGNGDGFAIEPAGSVCRVWWVGH